MFWSAGCSLLPAEDFSCRLDVFYKGLGTLRDYTVRGQSNVWRLPKYWPLTARRVCTPPPLVQGEDKTHSLYSIYVSTLCLGISKFNFLDQKYIQFFSAVFFFNFWSLKPWIRIRKCWIRNTATGSYWQIFYSLLKSQIYPKKTAYAGTILCCHFYAV